MLLYINLIQFALGTFLDMAAHILITTPLFLPLAIQMGVGPVQFGMMLLLNCALGLPRHRSAPCNTWVRHRRGVHRRTDEDDMAVLSGDMGGDTARDLRAEFLHVAAIADHRAHGALGDNGVTSRRPVSVSQATVRPERV